MIPIHHDWAEPDDTRRAALYDGALLVTSPTATTREFCDFTRSLVEEAFGGLDAERAQYELPVDQYATILGELKPRFIHHPRSREFVQAILGERGCDLEQTYLDVPRLRTSTSDGYLTTGIAYAWHPHRDTWYSAPMAQLNYWMPVYDIEAGNAMAFHLDYFDAALSNTSETYNYYVWNQRYRAAATTNIGQETRPLPGPTSPVESPEHDHRGHACRRHAAVLRPTPPLKRAQPHGKDPLLDRLPHSPRRRHCRTPVGPQRRCELQRLIDSRLHPRI